MSDQTTIIREIAEDVYQTLGSGFSEEVYDRAMQVGLRLAKIGYEGQKVVELKYKDHYVGEGYPDLVVHLVNEKLIVELKAISGELGASEEQQLLNYMTAQSLPRTRQHARMPTCNRLTVPLTFKQFLSAVLLRISPIQNFVPSAVLSLRDVRS